MALSRNTITVDDSTFPYQLPDLPEVKSLVPRMMTATELQENLVRLFEWLQAAEASPQSLVVEQRLVDEVRDAVNLLLEERRDRHSDETGFRGG